MESHRIVIVLALFAACALYVSGATVQPPVPADPTRGSSLTNPTTGSSLTNTTRVSNLTNPTTGSNHTTPEPKAEQKIRSKKWTTFNDYFGYSSYHAPLAYAAYAPSYSYFPSSYYHIPSPMYSRYYYY